MNTYALSDCLTLPPEPFVSCKGPKRKVNADITFLRRQISVQESRLRGIDSHKVKLSCGVFFFSANTSELVGLMNLGRRFNQKTMIVIHLFLCSCLNKQTFSLQTVFWGPHFPLRTACLFSYCLITSLKS